MATRAPAGTEALVTPPVSPSGASGAMSLPAVRYFPVILSAIIGTFVTIAAFLLVCSWEYRVAVIDFQSRAKSYVEIINADLTEANSLLYTLAGFIGANDRPVTANEFARFSAALHRRVSGLRDTAWAPRITLAERPEFERDTRAAGIARYEVRQFGAHRKLVRATPRLTYYPLLYIESAGAKRPMLGFDLISEKLRARVVKHALASGAPAATPPMDVNTVRQRGAGVLSYMPVYVTSSGATGLPAARGLVLGVFDIPALVKNIFDKRADSMRDLDLYLFNPAAVGARRLIYRTASADGPGTAVSEQALRAGAHSESSVLLIDQQLGAIVTPAQQLQRIRWSLFGTLTLIAGFTMTAMIVVYLLLSIRRTVQLEALTARLVASTEQITQMSLHDALTGMPNRVLFRERMEYALARFRRGAPFALLFLDLDRFKAVNDSLGHAAGDQLLCAVAGRINGSLRETDTAARLGGDEFAALVADTADSSLISIVANRLIENISKPYMIGNTSVVIGVSIGVAIVARGATADDVVAEADVAMYEAKAAGRGTLRFFDGNARARATQQLGP